MKNNTLFELGWIGGMIALVAAILALALALAL